jgi:SAM-dependent methyltransferase
MSAVFGREYSGTYDLVYEGKDYEGECTLIETIIRKYSKIPVHSILDLGCGTGNHSLLLARRGYEVTGVDRSIEMLDIAREKSRKEGLDCIFHQSDLREFCNHKKYDVIIMMFAVLGYQQQNDDVLAALKTVSNHLKKGGIFICDVWYGPAVLNQKPGERVRVIRHGEQSIIRVSSGVLNTFRHSVDVHFQVWNIREDRVLSEIKEHHTMRFFFPQELALLFEFSGIELQDIRNFPEWDKEPDDETWNIGVVGLAV